MNGTCRCIILYLLLTNCCLYAQSASPDPESLPTTIQADRKVHFVSIDDAFTAPNTNWLPCLKILTGGDHVTEAVTIGGHSGVKVGGIKFNTDDENFPFWADKHSIDILMQIYGDEALLD